MIVKCKFCDGTGREYDAWRGYVPCSVCNGAGEIDIDIEEEFSTVCKFCNGNGREHDAWRGIVPCHVCEGLGIVERPHKKKANSSKIRATNSNRPLSRTNDYDIAVSFAGEDRGIVEKYVSHLKQQNVRVFYDTHERADLWGEDLFEKLDDIYRNRAKYCVILDLSPKFLDD